MRVYISGKMTGVADFNYPLFNRVAKEFRDAGIEVENPAEHFGGDTSLSRAKYLSHDYKVLTETVEGRPCIDLIVMLPGWEDSTGSVSEKAVAAAMGIPFALYSDAAGVKGVLDLPESSPAGEHSYSETARAVRESVKMLRGEPWDWPPNGPTGPKGDKGEVVVVDKETGGRKGMKLARFDLIPAKALWYVAEIYGFGAQKYDDNNWRKGYDWKLSFGAMQRHAWAFWGGEDTDPQSGLPHIAHAAWHCFTLLTFMEEQEAKDSRWKKEGL